MRKLVVFALLLSLGCKDEPSVVGKWTGTLGDNQVSAEFQPDKTMTFGVKVGSMGADVTGDYKIDEKNLTLTFKAYKLKAVPEALTASANTLMKQLIANPFKTAYHFNSPDALAVTYNGTTDVWTRVKESE